MSNKNLFDDIDLSHIDSVEDFLRNNSPSERGLKISSTSRFKMATDAEFRKIRQQGAQKSADVKRKIPKEDYASIILEYWDPNVKRKHGFIDVIAARYSLKQGYGSKLTGQVEKIILNRFNTFPDNEYAAMRAAWEQNNPNFRSEMIKDLNKSGKRQVSRGRSHSEKCHSISEQLARQIYNTCLSGSNTRSHDFYKQLAEQHNMNWHAVQAIALGNHYSLTDVNVKHDVEQWRLNLGEGNYEMIDPDGKSHLFADLRELGYFIQTTEGKPNNNTAKNWSTARNWFEGLKANTWYTKERRTFRGWKYCNHLPAKAK